MNIKWLIFTHKLLISKPKFTSGYTLGNDDNQVKKKLNDKSSALSHICVRFKTIISFGLSLLHSSFRRHVLQVFFLMAKTFSHLTTLCNNNSKLRTVVWSNSNVLNLPHHQ